MIFYVAVLMLIAPDIVIRVDPYLTNDPGCFCDDHGAVIPLCARLLVTVFVGATHILLSAFGSMLMYLVVLEFPAAIELSMALMLTMSSCGR